MTPFLGTYPLTSTFGNRDGGFHTGVDYGMPEGTPLYAVKSGFCYYATDSWGGKYMDIKTGNELYRYVHLSMFNIPANYKDVKEGDIIGYSGNTGNSTGPHLHFEMRINNVPIDPVNFISQEKSKMDEILNTINNLYTKVTELETKLDGVSTSVNRLEDKEFLKMVAIPLATPLFINVGLSNKIWYADHNTNYVFKELEGGESLTDITYYIKADNHVIIYCRGVSAGDIFMVEYQDGLFSKWEKLSA
jgi:hypothetical protein